MADTEESLRNAIKAAATRLHVAQARRAQARITAHAPQGNESSEAEVDAIHAELKALREKYKRCDCRSELYWILRRDACRGLIFCCSIPHKTQEEVPVGEGEAAISKRLVSAAGARSHCHLRFFDCAGPAHAATASRSAARRPRRRPPKRLARPRSRPLPEVRVRAAWQASSRAGEEKVAEEDEELDPSKYFALRSAQIEAAKARGENPYPHKFHVSSSIKHFLDKVHRAARVALLNRTAVCQPEARRVPHRYGERGGARVRQAQRQPQACLLRPPRREREGAGAGGIRVCTHAHAMRLRETRCSKHTEVANGESTFFAIHDTVHRGDIIGIVGNPSAFRRSRVAPAHSPPQRGPRRAS